MSNPFELRLQAPEYRYTDRDVREDVGLRCLAEAYTQTYGGEFEPVVNAKRELVRNGRLSTLTARTVLNCMRNDVNAQHLLRAPRPPALELVPGGKQEPRPFCGDTRPHGWHSQRTGRRFEECNGVPWPINRGNFGTQVRVKAFYAAAAMSPIYHMTSGKGSLTWVPPLHSMGQATASTLWVYLLCRYPSILSDPTLFIDEPTHLISTVKKQPGARRLCPHCAKERGL
jgi:hypothetical protein